MADDGSEKQELPHPDQGPSFVKIFNLMMEGDFTPYNIAQLRGRSDDSEIKSCTNLEGFDYYWLYKIQNCCEHVLPEDLQIFLESLHVLKTSGFGKLEEIANYSEPEVALIEKTRAFHIEDLIRKVEATAELTKALVDEERDFFEAQSAMDSIKDIYDLILYSKYTPPFSDLFVTVNRLEGKELDLEKLLNLVLERYRDSTVEEFRAKALSTKAVFEVMNDSNDWSELEQFLETVWCRRRDIVLDQSLECLVRYVGLGSELTGMGFEQIFATIREHIGPLKLPYSNDFSEFIRVFFEESYFSDSRKRTSINYWFELMYRYKQLQGLYEEINNDEWKAYRSNFLFALRQVYRDDDPMPNFFICRFYEVLCAARKIGFNSDSERHNFLARVFTVMKIGYGNYRYANNVRFNIKLILDDLSSRKINQDRKVLNLPTSDTDTE